MDPKSTKKIKKNKTFSLAKYHPGLEEKPYGNSQKHSWSRSTRFLSQNVEYVTFIDRAPHIWRDPQIIVLLRQQNQKMRGSWGIGVLRSLYSIFEYLMHPSIPSEILSGFEKNYFWVILWTNNVTNRESSRSLKIPEAPKSTQPTKTSSMDQKKSKFFKSPQKIA